jgi:hypothetical protein
MHLYNFIYYKSLFNFDNYDYLIRYNNYYISGLYSKECTIPKNNEIKRDTTIKALHNIEKIELSKFTYPILHKNKDEDDEEDNEEDKEFKSKLKNIFKEDEEDEEEEKKNLNSKLRDYIDKDDNKTSDDDEEKPNIFKRIFGF